MSQWIAESVRNAPKLRRLVRQAKMMYVRWRYRLHSVHSTFYLGGEADLASDFIAGPYSYVGRGCCICPRVAIGAYTYLAHDVTILGGDHVIDKPGIPACFGGRPEMPATVIEADVWVGHRAIIMAGVRIGRAAVIGAGAVVTKDVPPYTIVGGVPATKLRMRFEREEDRNAHDVMLAREPFAGDLPPQRVPGVSGN